MTSNEKYRNIFYLVAFVDLLLAMCTVFMALFVVAFIAMNPVTQKNGNIISDAQVMIEISWPMKPDCDVDLWVKDPENVVVYFSHKEGAYGHLERDSMGSVNNTLVDPTGKPITVGSYKEDWFLRAMIPGEYRANVHLYSCQTPEGVRMKPGQIMNPPIPITMTVQKLNPRFQSIFERKFELNTTWEEYPVVKFELDKDGYPRNVGDNDEKWVDKNIQATVQTVPGAPQ